MSFSLDKFIDAVDSVPFTLTVGNVTHLRPPEGTTKVVVMGGVDGDGPLEIYFDGAEVDRTENAFNRNGVKALATAWLHREITQEERVALVAAIS